MEITNKITNNMRKIIITTLLSIVCVLANAQFSGKGSGTLEDPYKIETPFNVDEIRNFAGLKDVHFILTSDIDMTDFISDNYGDAGWYPIPDFCGNLDGEGHTITGLKINRPTFVGVGFISTAKSAQINNLTLKYDDDIMAGNYAAALIADANNCKIYRCKIIAKKIISSGSCIGGLIGVLEKGEIKECICSFSEIRLNDVNNDAGGLVGHTNGLSVAIKDNKVAGNVVNNFGKAGGIVGTADGYTSIDNNLFEGNVTGNYVGGLYGFHAGINHSNVIISDVICSPKSSYSSLSRIGFNLNNLSPELSDIRTNRAYVNTKLIAGEKEITVEDNKENGLSTGLAMLKQKSVYAIMGWDMENVWTIDNDNSFPKLKWEVEKSTELTKCPTPTITYANGRLYFSCECKEKPEYHVSISSPDVKDVVQSEDFISLEGTYNIEGMFYKLTC